MTTEQKIIRAMLAVCGVGVRIIVMSGKEIRLRQTYAPLPMTTVCAVISGLTMSETGTAICTVAPKVASAT
jgi:hypothetical protein